jgi:hypothetical protein
MPKIVLREPFTHEQLVASNAWTVTHNLNTLAPVVDVYITNGAVKEELLAQDVAVIDRNTVKITFSSALTGKVVII